jgi:broad specificity phosphatase PhoE
VSDPALILVRHARPQIAPDASPPRWGLSAEGRAAAAAMAGRLPRFAAVVASTEPKAVETAQILAAPHELHVSSDARFDEHRREAWPFEPDPAAVTARVRRALAAPDASIDGAETIDAAAQRLAEGIAAHAARPLLAVSHGTVIAAWLAPRLALDPVELWTGIGMPEAFVLDAEGGLIERIA